MVQVVLADFFLADQMTSQVTDEVAMQTFHKLDGQYVQLHYKLRVELF